MATVRQNRPISHRDESRFRSFYTVNTEADREPMLRSIGLGIEFTLPNWVDEVIVSIKKLSGCMQVANQGLD